MDVLTKILGFVSPSLALKREINSFRLGAFSDHKRAYDAASKGRRTDGWVTTDSSAKSEVSSGIKTLRDRSRELVRNNSYAKKAVKAIYTNTIGTGIRPNPVGSKAANARLKQAWKDWAETKQCDFDGKKNIYGIQALVMRTIAISGECIIIKKVNRDKKAIIPFQLQVLEADLIDGYKQSVGKNSSLIYDGVQYSRDGKLEGYWLFDSHPGDKYLFNTVSSFHKKENVIHVFFEERPGQHRGIPFGAASFTRLRDFDIYEDAELLKQQVSSLFAAFIENSSGDTLTGKKGPNFQLTEKMEPGSIQHLAPNEKITIANPPSKEGYDDYTRTTLQGVAAGFDVTYEAMTGNLREVNFSSGRMGWLEFQRAVIDWQENMIIPMLCEDVWAWFIEGCKIVGITNKDITATWTSPRREMIDPVKETEGITNQVRAGLVSWPEAVRQQGYEPDDVLDEIIVYSKKFEASGLQLTTDARYDKTKITGKPNASDGA